jgi:hypothetical protein
MATDPFLGITLLEAAQAQPEVVINEAIYKLAAMSPLQAADKDLNDPPSTPDDGDRYIVGANPTGDWVGHGFDVALNINGTWHFLEPRPGWTCYVIDEGIYYQFIPGSPTGWSALADAA